MAPLPGIGLRTGGSGLEIVLLLAGAILLTRFATWLGGGSQTGSTPAPGGGRAFPGSWQLPRTASVPPRRAMAVRPGRGLVAWGFRFSVQAGKSGQS